MKKTVAAIALSASSSAFGLMAPPEVSKTICLATYATEAGVLFAGACDEAFNNKILGLELLENGCAEDQIAVPARKFGDSWDISIQACLPPNVVQL